MSRTAHRGNGWAALDYSNKHNKIPQIQPPTRWEQWLGGVHMTVEDVLLAAKCPKSLTAHMIECELREQGFFHTYYVPDRVIDAYGLRAELEHRIDGNLTGGRPRKPKVKRVSMPLLERVRL